MSMREPKKLVTLYDMHPKASDVKAEVLAGLTAARKTLPPKLFYDKKGSELFEEITCLTEYYPTRTEIGILRSHCQEMIRCMGERCVLIEFGSGSSVKVRILLDEMNAIAAATPLFKHGLIRCNSLAFIIWKSDNTGKRQPASQTGRLFPFLENY